MDISIGMASSFNKDDGGISIGMEASFKLKGDAIPIGRSVTVKDIQIIQKLKYA